VPGDHGAAPRTWAQRRATFWEWSRHHASALVTTGVDYAFMIACVELLGFRPVPATVVGALAGAVTSFTLGRLFTYRATAVGVARQSWRYALVAGASLVLNAVGEHVFSDILKLQYLVARVITSVIVSNAWNYPLQRFFVFSRRAEGSQHPTHPAS
jgi:putative flippase GtrA